MNDARKRFFAELKTKFFPRLRQAGFVGSGQHFRRIKGEVAHAVSIRGDKYGDMCHVGVGMHLTFLPGTFDQPIDFKKIREYECEFRLHNIFPKRKVEGWLYLWGSAEVEELTDAYFTYCEPILKKFERVEDFVNAIPVSALSDLKLDKLPFGLGTRARAGLTYARIHKHLGNTETCRKFAQFCLQNGGAELLMKAGLTEMLNEA